MIEQLYNIVLLVAAVANIVMGINKRTGSFIKLQAKQIDLSGYVTMKAFQAEQAKINDLMTGRARAATIQANSVKAGSSLMLGGHSLHTRTLTIDGQNYNLVTWG